MEVMNEFLKENFSKLSDYLDQVIRVAEPEDHIGFVSEYSDIRMKKTIVISTNQLNTFIGLFKANELVGS
jgi:hypothetical protein